MKKTCKKMKLFWIFSDLHDILNFLDFLIFDFLDFLETRGRDKNSCSDELKRYKSPFMPCKCCILYVLFGRARTGHGIEINLPINSRAKHKDTPVCV